MTEGSQRRKTELKAKQLHADWQAALHAKQAGNETPDWPQLMTTEQETWDELIDFLEANDLNESSFDPRNNTIEN